VRPLEVAVSWDRGEGLAGTAGPPAGAAFLHDLP
jgi:hypothetical protein